MFYCHGMKDFCVRSWCANCPFYDGNGGEYSDIKVSALRILFIRLKVSLKIWWYRVRRK